ncbi:MAG: SusC/RagA family TonB-linked outer membrane protein [Dysgonamonadaceae bacterium]|nr:SusC/RagA family TonB-linked outer membrane protein [Dysgonamonadaceae bacterium]
MLSFNLFAQDPSIKITLPQGQITIRLAFESIEQQSNLSIAYNESVINVNKNITVNVINKSLSEALAAVLHNTGTAFRIQNNQIIIVPHTPQQYTGSVKDKNGTPLIGASVAVQGTTIATMADVYGNFSLSNAAPGQVLVVSYLGYESKEIVLGNQTTYDIVLNEMPSTLEEVVVTALGIKRAEKALSYNVQKVSGEELTTVKSANFMNALAGKVAGVTVNSSAAGPGAAVKVVMRGAKSLSKNNNALYVIDGIPMYNSNYGNDTKEGLYATQPGSEGAADINPDDIESMTLLTGPSAAALYGYEGANGVVLITTKKGRADKTTVTVSNTSTFSSPLLMPKFQNTYGNMPGSVTSWGDKTDFRYDPAKFFNTGTNITNSVSLATGNDRSQTYLSAAATNAAGILPNNDYSRYNFSFRNTTAFLNNKLELDVNANFIIQEDKNMISQGQYFNPLPALYLFPRGEDFSDVQVFERYDDLTGVNTQYWSYGDQGLSLQNPYWIMHRMNKESSKRRYKLATNLQYNITDWMNILGRINIDNSLYRYTEKRYAGTLAIFAGAKGNFKLENREERQTYGDVLLNINKALGDFSITANIGASIKDLRTTGNYTLGNLDKITNLFTVENLSRTSGFKTFQDELVHQAQSVFANAEIGYKSMVYLTLTGRNDWDSALAFSESGDKSFFYPSVGLSGIISEMVTLPNWFSLLKARLSYTSVGSAYDPYITREIYEYNDQTNQYNTRPLYPNRNLKPELTNSWEAGLNLRFFNSDLHVDATYYKSNTLNQTFIADVPETSGYTGVYVQAGDVQNEGIELALGYRHSWGGFSWASNFTYSYNNNVVKKLANDVVNPVTGELIQMSYLDKATLGSTGSPIVRLTEGGTMGDMYVNRDWKRNENGYILLDPKTFIPSIEDTEYTKIGSLLAKSHAGWRNSFSYKGVTLNILFSGRFGGMVVSNTQAILDRYGVSESSAQLREKGGVTISNLQVSAQNYLNVIAAGTGQGAHYVYDATNIRLAEVSIEYTIPKKWVANIADITVGLVGNNLALLYCKAPFDPELVASATNTFYTGVDYFMLPSLRNFCFSIKLQF